MPTATKDLADLVHQAQEATEGLDDELRTVAFERVLDHLLGAAGNHRTAGTGSQGQKAGKAKRAEAADGILASEQQRIDALARYFKIEPEDVSHVFDAAEDEPKLAIPVSRLAKAKSHATREIVLLVTGAFTALGLDTTTKGIRRVADDYGKLDRPSFMTTLTNLDEVSVLGRPRSPNRIIRMKAVGAEAVRSLVREKIS